MYTLKPFSPIAHDLRLQGRIARQGRNLELHFELYDPGHVVNEGLQSAAYSAADLKRTNDLWKTTCFEAFFGIVGSTTYWEVNLSPRGPYWNLYHFDNYRQPQPPTASYDFEIASIQTLPTSLTCLLQSQGDLPAEGAWQANLTAVLKTTQDPIYMAVQHANQRPDFHDRTAFGILF